ncbi:MAG: DUF6603 domain-containing protein [Pseudomonadales bacterium]
MYSLTSTTLAALREELAGMSAGEIDNLVTDGGILTINNREIHLSVTLADEKLTLSLQQGSSVNMELSSMAQCANATLVDYLPTAIDIFTGNLPLTKIEITWISDKSIDFSYNSTVDTNWEVISQILTLESTEVNLFSKYEIISGNLLGSFWGNVGGHFNIDGVDYQAIVHFQGPYAWELEIIPANGNILPGLDSLAQLLGGESLKTTVSNGLNTLGLEEIAIDDVKIGFDLASSSLRYVSMGSHITIAGVQMDLYTRLPDFEFGGTLAPDSTISVKSLIQHFFYVADGFPEIDITDLSFSAYPSTGTYTLSVDTESDLNVAIGNGSSIGINKIAFTIEKAPDFVTVEISGSFAIAGIDVFVLTEAGGASTGWQFSGNTGLGEEIPVGELINDLGKKFGIGISLPKPIKTLSLKDLATAFNTQSQDFTFSGEADFKVKSVDVAIQSHINITHRQDGTAEKNFSGKLTLETTRKSLIFDLIFDKDETNTLLLAGYHSVNGDTVSIAELVGSILEFTIPNVLSFTLKDAVLAYNAATDAADKKALFATHIGNGINLSNLPLLGKLFPEGKTLSLNYQIVAASGEFDATTVGTINRLLPVGISPLGDQAISQGLGVSAVLNISGEPFPFELPIAVNDDTDTDGSDPVKLDPNSPVVADNSVKWINLQKAFGPIHISRIGIQYEDSKLKFILDASLSGAGLTIAMAGLSVASPLTQFAPVFDLKGLSIDFQNEVMEMGAAFLREHIGNPSPEGYDEYSGLAVIRFKEFGLSGIGAYAFVKGQPSLFVYAAVNAPIGGDPAFFVTGFSGGLGYNRALHVPSIDRVLEFPFVAEAMNGKSLPNGAGKQTLVEELEAIQRYIPVGVGQMFLAAGISFTTYKILDTTVLLVGSFGTQRFEFDLLGVSTLLVPPGADLTPVPPVAVLQLALKGAFVPSEGAISVEGQLTTSSYIFSPDCHLTGGFAFYFWYYGEHAGDFVISAGGYHPQLKVPVHYPRVARLGFRWTLDSHTHIKGGTYFALCPYAIMAGGLLEASFEEGPLKVWFTLGADFIMPWEPCFYQASIYVNLRGSYTYHFFGTHHITVDVGADVDIWGQEFGGHATVDLKVCSIGVDFGASRPSVVPAIDWDKFETSFLPDRDKLCTLSIAGGLVGRGESDESLGVVNPKELAIVTDAFIPSKEITWGNTSLAVADWNSNFGIGSMAIAASALTCSQAITVEKNADGAGTWVDYTTHFKYKIRTKKAPAGLWGTKLLPAVNDDPFIENAFSGLEIIPGSEPTPGKSESINRDFVKFETSPIDNAIAWETRAAFVAADLTEAQARTEINNSVIAKTSERNALLGSLGIAETIDLSDSIADDYIIAPQVMKAA